MSSRPSNRLISEKSPYLLQHAHNPVDWYPWGEEAFERARTDDKPIFLSIGYATCHWCHVMERESFDNEKLAEKINEVFVCVKVDREELPEVDSLYMDFAQGLLPGAVGWPLTVILTPDLKPFFAATYLPPMARAGMLGVWELVERIKSAWNSPERSRILHQAESLVEMVSAMTVAKGDALPRESLILNGAEQVIAASDPVYGGLSGAPKFPVSYQSCFLTRCTRQLRDNRPLFIAERTHECMARGGIFDHLGGGFSRYSIDDKWLVPHFEKMLYDNAILASSYLELYAVTRRPSFRHTAEQVLEYLLRDMHDPMGAFHSGEDADSEGEEGRFYTWTPDEIREALGEVPGLAFCKVYGVDGVGQIDGRSVLHLPTSIGNLADKGQKAPEELERDLEQMRSVLREVRNQRPRPAKDDKVITSWNGLAMQAFAQAYAVLGEEAYYAVAEEVAEFIQKHLYQHGHLLRRWRDGQARFTATLEDYADVIKGLLTLFEQKGEARWLQWAIELSEVLKKEFKEPDGAFYQTDGDDPNLIVRKCQYSDGAEPSGNAVHTENLLRLYQITWDRRYRDQAEEVMRAVRPFIEAHPPAYTYHLMALQRYYSRNNVQIVIALDKKQSLREEIRQAMYGGFIPHHVVVWKREGDQELLKVLPDIEVYQPVKGKTTVYICREGQCEAPLSDIESIRQRLEKLWL